MHLPYLAALVVVGETFATAAKVKCNGNSDTVLKTCRWNFNTEFRAQYEPEEINVKSCSDHCFVNNEKKVECPRLEAKGMSASAFSTSKPSILSDQCQSKVMTDLCVPHCQMDG